VDNTNASIGAARHLVGMGNDPKANPAGDGETIARTAASGGQKTGHIRWVLWIGTALAVIGLLIAWFVMRR
jgi:hypothetical protein